MNTQRRSGEIVNATLLEVFLSFIFVVLAVAVFKVVEAQTAEENAERQRERAEQAEQENDRTRSERDAARQERDSLEQLYQSEHPPSCRKEYFLDVTLNAPEEWTIRVNYTVLRHKAGDLSDLEAQVFLEHFNDVRIHSFQKQRCRYPVLVYDTDAVNKDEYQRAIRAIRKIFYVAERD